MLTISEYYSVEGKYMTVLELYVSFLGDADVRLMSNRRPSQNLVRKSVEKQMLLKNSNA